MSTHRSLRDLLHEQDGATNEPLMSETELRSLLATTPPYPTIPNQPRPSRTIAAVGTAVAGLALAATVAFPPTDVPPTESPTNSSSPAVAGTTHGTAARAVRESIVITDTCMAYPTGTLPVAATQATVQPPIRTLDLNRPLLERLGFEITPRSIAYDDGTSRLHVTTAGITAAGGGSGRTPAPPVVVELYVNGVAADVWYDTRLGSTTAAAINGLLPVRIDLADTRNTFRPRATVVLWLPPTDAVRRTVHADTLYAFGIDTGTTTSATSTPTTSGMAGALGTSVVFPNPTRTGTATLDLTVQRTVQTSAVVVDIFGTVLHRLWQGRTLTADRHRLPIDGLADLPNGMVMIVVTVDGTNEQIVQRLILER